MRRISQGKRKNQTRRRCCNTFWAKNNVQPPDDALRFIRQLSYFPYELYFNFFDEVRNQSTLWQKCTHTITHSSFAELNLFRNVIHAESAFSKFQNINCHTCGIERFWIKLLCILDFCRKPTVLTDPCIKLFSSLAAAMTGFCAGELPALTANSTRVFGFACTAKGEYGCISESHVVYVLSFCLVNFGHKTKYRAGIDRGPTRFTWFCRMDASLILTLLFREKKGRLIETAQPSCCVGGYVTCIGVEGGGALSTLSFCILFYSLIISDHENSNNRCCTQFSKTALLDAHHKGSIEQGCFYALQKTSYRKLNFRLYFEIRALYCKRIILLQIEL